MQPVIIVTGASRGIGAATARLAAERGYAVCVNYLQSRDAAEAIVEEIRGGGGKATAVQATCRVRRIAVRLLRHHGLGLTLTALVNNAGILETQMRSRAMDAAGWSASSRRMSFRLLCAREARWANVDEARRPRRRDRQRFLSGGASRLTGRVRRLCGLEGAVDALTVGLSQGRGRGFASTACARLIYTDIHASGNEPAESTASKPRADEAGRSARGSTGNSVAAVEEPPTRQARRSGRRRRQ
jgi:hypothetical protein